MPSSTATDPLASAAESSWTREALRLCDRYLREVVLTFGLCPWAEPALRSGQVAQRVWLRCPVDPVEVLSVIDELEAMNPPSVEIGLVLFPGFMGDWTAFDVLGERVRRADRARRPAPTLPEFLIATFHPGGLDTLTHPNHLLSFVRRSPDPMLQLVRASTVYDLKDRHPHLSDEIARNNWETLLGRSDALARAVADIQRDRAATYDRLPPLSSPPSTASLTSG